MASENLSVSDEKAVKKSLLNSTFARVAKYTAVRFASLLVTVVISIYLTILIANMGGYVDTIMRNEIHDSVAQSILTNPASRNMSSEVRSKLIQEKIALAEKRLHLDEPFAIRSIRYLRNAMTLNLGRAQHMTSNSGSKQVRLILL